MTSVAFYEGSVRNAPDALAPQECPTLLVTWSDPRPSTQTEPYPADPEVQVTIAILRHLNLPRDEIAVLCLYKAQLKLFRDKGVGKSAQLLTVDKSQGGE